MTEPRGRVGRGIGIALLPVLLAACATTPTTPTTTVVLLPSKDGHKTAVAVKQGDKEVVLDEPYAGARLTASGPTAYKSSPQEVQSLAGAAMDALPARATTFTLYFVEGKEEFTAESKQVVDGMFSELAKRSVPDIVIIGHTDSTGSDQFNDALAQRRADLVKTELVRRGIKAESVQAISRGKRDPAVRTATGVSEARNRRVEIIVR